MWDHDAEYEDKDEYEDEEDEEEEDEEEDEEEEPLPLGTLAFIKSFVESNINNNEKKQVRH